MKELLNLAIDASKDAAKAILKHYNDFKIYTKEDNTPVTDADYAANEAILNILQKSNLPICSEERILQNFNDELYWLIDPIDGTKHFISKDGEFCTCIALIKNFRPIISLINSPTTNEIFYTMENEKVFLNGEILKQETPKNSFVLGQFSKMQNTSTLAKEFGYEIKKLGSALKFTHLAQQKAGIFLGSNKTSIWDIASGDLILKNSGGIVLDLKTLKEPIYNPKNLKNNNFLALSKANLDKKNRILEFLKLQGTI